MKVEFLVWAKCTLQIIDSTPMPPFKDCFLKLNLSVQFQKKKKYIKEK